MRKAPGMAVIVGTAMLGALCGDGELQAEEHFNTSWALKEIHYRYKGKMLAEKGKE